MTGRQVPDVSSFTGEGAAVGGAKACQHRLDQGDSGFPLSKPEHRTPISSSSAGSPTELV